MIPAVGDRLWIGLRIGAFSGVLVDSHEGLGTVADVSLIGFDRVGFALDLDHGPTLALDSTCDRVRPVSTVAELRELAEADPSLVSTVELAIGGSYDAWVACERERSRRDDAARETARRADVNASLRRHGFPPRY